MSGFLLDIFGNQEEETVKQTEQFIAFPPDNEIEQPSGVSSTETVETAFLTELNKITRNKYVQ